MPDSEPPLRVIIWSLRSRNDLERIHAYIGQFRPLAAQQFAARLIAMVESLQRQPERGRPIRGEIRELVAIWPYVIRYRVTPTAVEVIRIRHGAQQPD